MQLLYANDGTNYRTISKSSVMSTKIEKTLLQSYMKYDFVMHQEIYSSVSKEPEALIYAISNLNNELPEECLIITKTGHMSNYSSPSYYLHAYLERVNDAFFKDKFFEIFNYKFVEDRYINHYKRTSIDQYQFYHHNYEGIYLNNDQLITILAHFMNNERTNKKTKIIVDQSGDQYNIRSRQILASIYHYLPYELRKRHGFLSYSKDGECYIGRVSFVLTPKEELRSIDPSFIQLDHIDLNELSRSVDQKYIDYARYLVELDENERTLHFDKLSKITNQGRLKIDDCLTYYANLEKWQNASQEECLPEWINYVEANSFRKGPLYEMMVKIISDKVDVNYYNDYLFNRIKYEKLDSLSLNAAKAIRFADAVRLKIDPKRFLDWCENQFYEKIKDKDPHDPSSVLMIQKTYQKEIDRVRSLDIGSQQFKNLLIQYASRLKKEKAVSDHSRQELEDQELDQFSQEFGSLKYASIAEFKDRIKEIKDQIIFEDNIDMFYTNVDDWIEDYLKQASLKESQLNELKEMINASQKYIHQKCYREFMTEIDQRLHQLEEERKSKTFDIQDMSSVILSYHALLNDLEREILSLDTEVDLTLGDDHKKIEAGKLKMLLEFILMPSTMDISIRESLDDLYKLTLLKADHFRYLIENQDENEIRRVINYYFKRHRPVQISGKYVADMLEQYAPKVLKRIEEHYMDDTDPDIEFFIEELRNNKKKKNKESTKSQDSFDETFPFMSHKSYFEEEEVKEDVPKKKGFGFFRK